MKRLLGLFLLLALLSACAAPAQEVAATWEEQYDLGLRYMTDGNYEEAIIAFNAAIEIDPKRAEAYLSLADAYVATGNTEKALEVLSTAPADVEGRDRLLEKAAELTAVETTDASGDTESVAAEENLPLVPLEGYPKTERVDYVNGRYAIVEYDEFGREIINERFFNDGSRDVTEWTEYWETGTVRRVSYQNFSEKNGDWIETVSEYDTQRRITRSVDRSPDRDDQIETTTEVYTYSPDGLTATVKITHEEVVRGVTETTFTYRLEQAGNYFTVNGWTLSRDQSSSAEDPPMVLKISHITESRPGIGVVKRVEFDD